jgi:hypothetical protein
VDLSGLGGDGPMQPRTARRRDSSPSLLSRYLSERGVIPNGLAAAVRFQLVLSRALRLAFFSISSSAASSGRAPLSMSGSSSTIRAVARVMVRLLA